MSFLSRRRLLQAGTALAAAPLLGARRAQAQTAAPKSALLIIYAHGGYNSLFSSADSFIPAGTYGVTASNVRDLGNGLVVDKGSLGALPDVATRSMASIGVNHGQTGHDAAQAEGWSSGNTNYAIQLASVMGGDGPIKMAAVGNDPLPTAPLNSVGGVSLQRIVDMRATLIALGAPLDPSVPRRDIALQAMLGSQRLSRRTLATSPHGLRSVTDGYQASLATLRSQKVFDWDGPEGLATVYGLNPARTGVDAMPAKMAAAEMMIRAGANVVLATDGDAGRWDTHGDTDGAQVRRLMGLITPSLSIFLNRMMSDPAFNVVTLITGDFARSLPGSDHQGNLTTTVIGRHVQVGTTGRCAANVSLNPGTPRAAGLWAHLAQALRVPGQPFGPNPHGLVA